MVVLVTSCGCAATAMYVFAPAIAVAAFGNAANVALVRIGGMSLAFESLLLVPFAYLRLGDRSTAYVTVAGVRLCLQVALNIAFVVYLQLGAVGVLLSTLVVNTLAGAFLTVYLVKEVGLRLSGSAARDLLRFGIPFVGTQVATFIMTFADVLQSWTIMPNLGIQMRERTEFYTLANWIGAVVALAGYMLLIPRLFGLGAALATVASFAVREAAVYALSQRLWRIRYRWGPVLRLLLVATVIGVAGQLVPHSRLWLSLF